jgi:hypothetical protein
VLAEIGALDLELPEGRTGWSAQTPTPLSTESPAAG